MASLQYFISYCSLPLRTLCLSSSSSSSSSLSANSSSFRPRSQQQQSVPQGNKVHRKSVRGMEGQRNACNCCGRRNLLTSFGGAFLSGASNEQDSQAADVDYEIMEKVHPRRPVWYQELYAQVMNVGMQSYEVEMAGYKKQLFDHLGDNVRSIVEVGVGTGPNLKFYGGRSHIEKVIGVDPNERMARFAEQAALDVGLAPSQFEFLHGVAEGLPVADSSMDAAVCTLVMCSVTDVAATLKEVQRVLKPGGMFLFVEHVAAPDGSTLRFWQNLLDPVQQLVADGCHLSRNTLGLIEAAGFTSLDIKSMRVKGLSLISPHILGTARTPEA
ncbi:unnamed protein product [Sphagnum jensenii]|uniref:Methyltransferase type 11 domain-containing protein n=1 Tax=Sphagnum jensenii TaxID=128206 RepID=A0ABP0W410_9BRYO